MRFVDKQQNSRHMIMLHRSCTHRHAVPNLIEWVVGAFCGRKGLGIWERSLDLRLDPRTWLKRRWKVFKPHIKHAPNRVPRLEL